MNTYGERIDEERRMQEERQRQRQADLRAQEREQVSYWIKTVSKVLVGLIVGVVSLSVIWGFIGPQLRLYKANVEKQAAIADARALDDSAEFLKNSEITRAEGVAEANRIIADSLTDEYIRWLYVDQLDETNGQIIYIPTEAGLPILEAGRETEGETP